MTLGYDLGYDLGTIQAPNLRHWIRFLAMPRKHFSEIVLDKAHVTWLENAALNGKIHYNMSQKKVENTGDDGENHHRK